MTTRFYFSTDPSPQGMTPAFDASWGQTTNAIRRRMRETKVGYPFANTAISETNVAVIDVLVAQFISEPIRAQTISGNVKGIIRALESAADADFRAQLLIKVVSETGATVRGTLLAHDTSALASEFDATTLTNRKFPLAWTGSGTALSSVVAQENDRIIIEIGFRAHNTTTTGKTGTLAFGCASASDLAEDETSTNQYAPWIEFDTTVSMVVPVTSQSRSKEANLFEIGLRGARPASNYGDYGRPSGLPGYATTDGISFRRPLGALGNNTNFQILPPSTVTKHYLMRWLDVDCGSPTYRTWHTTGSPDPTGTAYSGSKCGATPISGAVVAAYWET